MIRCLPMPTRKESLTRSLTRILKRSASAGTRERSTPSITATGIFRISVAVDRVAYASAVILDPMTTPKYRSSQDSRVCLRCGHVGQTHSLLRPWLCLKPANETRNKCGVRAGLYCGCKGYHPDTDWNSLLTATQKPLKKDDALLNNQPKESKCPSGKGSRNPSKKSRR